jgi:SAM-dependent methyltransferase
VTKFADHFSGHAAAYAQFRPVYPEALYDWLAACAPGHDLAWDVATGSGQAALPLAERFAAVFASEPSEAQLANAAPHPRVTYACEPAESCSLPDASVDLIAVAQALHWFDHPRFFAEVRRVLKPGGVFAAWCYELMHVSSPVDAVLLHYYDDVIGPYWPPQRRLLERGYIDIDMPLLPLDVPGFVMTAEWNYAQLDGYLQTWSATQRAAQVLGRDPLDRVRRQMQAAWGDLAERKEIIWPLAVRAGVK